MSSFVSPTRRRRDASRFYRLHLLFIAAFACATLIASIVPCERLHADELKVAQLERTEPVNFEKELLPILRKNCLACHNATDAEADVVLETPKAILASGFNDPILEAGKGAESLLFQVAAHKEEPVMPPEDNDVGAKNLTPEELALLKLWIDEGATGDVTGEGAEIEWFPLPPGVQPVFAISLAADGRYLAASRANQIFVYEAPTGKFLTRLTDPALLESGLYSQPGVAHLDHVQSLAFSPQGDVIASGGFRCVKVWRRDATPQASSDAAAAPAGPAVEVSADGKEISVRRDAGSVSITSPTKLNAAAAGSNAVVGAGDDGKVYVWSLTNAEPGAPETLEGHAAPVTAVATFDFADGEKRQPHALTGSADGGIRQWDLAAKKLVRELKQEAAITSLAAHPDGSQFVAAAANGDVTFWNAADGKLTATRWGTVDAEHRTLMARQGADLAANMEKAATAQRTEAEKKEKEAVEAEKKATETLAASRKSLKEKEAAAAAATGDSDDEKKKAEEAKKAVTAAKADVDKNQKALEDAQLTLKQARATLKKAGEELEATTAAKAAADERLEKASSEAQPSRNPVTKLKYSADGSYLAAIAGDRLHLYAGRDGGRIASLEIDADNSHSVAFVDAGVRVGDRVWALPLDREWKLERTIGSPDSGKEFVDRVTALRFSRDGRFLATGGGEPSRSGHLKLWNLEDGSLVWATSDAHSDTICDIDFSYDNRIIATGGTDKFARIFNADDGKLIRSFEGHTGHVLGVAWQANGKSIATSGADNVVKLWNVETGEQQRTIDGFQKQVTGIVFAGIGDTTVACSGDPMVRALKASDGKEQRRFEGVKAFLHCTEATPDGLLVAAGDHDGVVRVWAVADGRLLATLEPPQKTED